MTQHQMSDPHLDSEAEAEAAAALQQVPLFLGLADHVRRCWNAARDHKATIERVLNTAKRQRDAEYDPGKLRQIQEQGQPNVFLNLTGAKCRAVRAWITDTLLPPGDRPWSLLPTPIADLPYSQREDVATGIIETLLTDGVPAELILADPSQLQELTQKRLQEIAIDAAEQAERHIEERLVEAGWREALAAAIDDLVTYPAAILRGPVVRRRRDLAWSGDKKKPPVPTVEDRLVLEVERISPFDVFPAPTATDIDDGDLMVRHRLTRRDLTELIEVPGYDADAIRGVLHEHGEGGLIDWLSPETVPEFHGTDAASPIIDALEFWGSIQGRHLLEWGAEPSEVTDPLGEYDACVWMIGEWVIKAQINPDPLGRKPFFKASFETRPGEWWGRGLPQAMAASQSIVNAAVRALIANLGIASGPQVEVDNARIPKGEDITGLYPWKIWQMEPDKYGNGGPALRFFQPDTVAVELLRVLDRFQQMGDDETGIPTYVFGDPQNQGAASTASGLSMLMSAANKGIKGVIGNIDDGLIVPLIERFYVHLLMFDPDAGNLPGDLRVMARGASTLIVKEQQTLRRLEFLREVNNPIDSTIIGPVQRAELLREVARGVELNVDKIVPEPAQLAQQLADMAAPEPPDAVDQPPDATLGSAPGAAPGAAPGTMPGTAPGTVPEAALSKGTAQ